MRYIIAPLDLTTEQFEIYRLLYSKMDFDTMKVKYTEEQLAIDSNAKLLMTRRKASTIIKKFITDGLLEIYKKGSKGNPTIYSIIKIKDLIDVHQKEVKSNLKGINGTLKSSVNKGLNDVTDIKSNLKGINGTLTVHPINDIDIDKEKDTSIIDNQIIELWSLYPNKKGKQTSIKKLPKLIKKYGFEEIKRCVDRYIKECEVNKTDKKYIKHGDTFFNSGYVDYLDKEHEENKETLIIATKPVKKFETIAEAKNRKMLEGYKEGLKRG